MLIASLWRCQVVLLFNRDYAHAVLRMQSSYIAVTVCHALHLVYHISQAYSFLSFITVLFQWDILHSQPALQNAECTPKSRHRIVRTRHILHCDAAVVYRIAHFPYCNFLRTNVNNSPHIGLAFRREYICCMMRSRHYVLFFTFCAFSNSCCYIGIFLRMKDDQV